MTADSDCNVYMYNKVYVFSVLPEQREASSIPVRQRAPWSMNIKKSKNVTSSLLIVYYSLK